MLENIKKGDTFSHSEVFYKTLTKSQIIYQLCSQMYSCLKLWKYNFLLLAYLPTNVCIYLVSRVLSLPQANLCYLEGQWTNAKGSSIDEPFSSDRHAIDAKSFFDLQVRL